MSLTCLHLWAGDPVWHHQASVRKDTPIVPSPFVLGACPLGSMNGLSLLLQCGYRTILREPIRRPVQWNGEHQVWKLQEGLLPNSSGLTNHVSSHREIIALLKTPG